MRGLSENRNVTHNVTQLCSLVLLLTNFEDTKITYCFRRATGTLTKQCS